MTLLFWGILFLAITFGVYVIVSVKSSGDFKGFYVAGIETSPVVNGMAMAADWMSAATFLSMAGVIAFMGFSGCAYIMGWTGGYVLLTFLLAPFLRKLGTFTVPDFVADRYYSDTARIIALSCAIIICFLYVCGQVRGVGIILSRLFGISVGYGVVIGAVAVFLYSIFGGMKGILPTQAVQYVVITVSFVLPACAISYILLGNPIPQLALGSTIVSGADAGSNFLTRVGEISADLGFSSLTSGFSPFDKSMPDVLCITVALMAGTAGLPHVIMKYYVISSASSARLSAAYALLFISALYMTAPAVAAFTRYELNGAIQNWSGANPPEWFEAWQKTGLVRKNPASSPPTRPTIATHADTQGDFRPGMTPKRDQIFIDPDTSVLLLPELASLPVWLLALLFSGAMAAALSTAASQLLIVGSAVSHDFLYRLLNTRADLKQQFYIGSSAIAITVLAASIVAVYPPAFVAQIVAYAFGLAASSFFPAVILGMFWRRANSQGAIAGMLCGAIFTLFYVVTTGFLGLRPWFFGVSAEGIGTVGMIINFAVTIIVSVKTPPPPIEIQESVEKLHMPRIFHSR
jgi:cation/acetate symporter